MATEEGKEIISNGWKKTGIFYAIPLGSSQFPPLDTFNDVCSMLDNLVLNETSSVLQVCFPKRLIHTGGAWEIPMTKTNQTGRKMTMVTKLLNSLKKDTRKIYLIFLINNS